MARKKKRQWGVPSSVASEARAQATAEQENPSVLSRILGPLDVVGAAARSVITDAMVAGLRGTRRAELYAQKVAEGKDVLTALRESLAAKDEELPREEMPTTPQGVLGLIGREAKRYIGPQAMTTPQMMLMGAVGDIVSGEGKGRYHNPVEEASKALGGRQAGSYSKFYKAVYEAAPEEAEEAFYDPDNEALRAAVFVASDIFGDPTTYMTRGYSAATKARALSKLAEIGEGGITAEKLAGIGIDVGGFVAKHGDEFGDAEKLAQALEEGLPVERLTHSMSREIGAAARKWAGEALEGTPRKVGVPFLYKTEQGVRPGAWVPWLERLTPEEIAARSEILNKTLLERLGFKPSIKTFGAAAEGAEHVAVTLGKHGKDVGGIKLAGQTVLDVQPHLEAIADTVRRIMYGTYRAADETSAAGRIVEAASEAVAPVAKTLKGLFSQYAKIDAMGNEVLSAWARYANLRRMNDIRRASEVGYEVSRELTQRMSDEEAVRFLRAREEVLSPDEQKLLSDLVAERTQRAEKLAAYRTKHGLVDEGKVEKMLSDLGDKRASYEATVEEIDAQLDEIQERISAIADALGGAGKRSETIRRHERFLAGKAAGVERAARAGEGMFSDALDLVAKAEARAKKLLDEAEEAAKRGGERVFGKVPKPPASLDEFLARHAQEQASLIEEAERGRRALVDEVKRYLAEHDAVVHDPEMAGEIRAIFGSTPGLDRRFVTTGKTNKRIVTLDDLREAMSERGFPELVDADLATFLDALDQSRLAGKTTKAQRIAQAIGELPDEAFDAAAEEIAGYVRGALQRGQIDKAKGWHALLEEMAHGKPADVPFGEAWQAAHASPVASLADELKTAIEQAEKRGAAAGLREGAKQMGYVVGQGKRVVKRSMGRLDDAAADAERYRERLALLQEARKRIEELERAAKELKQKRASVLSMVGKLESKASVVQRRLDAALTQEAVVSALDEAILDVASRADYGKMREWLIGQDISPERADALVDISKQLDERVFGYLRDKLGEVGIQVKQKLPGRGSMGYSPHFDAEPPSPARKIGAVIEEKTGIPNPFEGSAKRAEREYLASQYGTTPEALEYPRAEAPWLGSTAWRAKKPQAAYYKTEAERLANDVAMELDARVAVALKARDDLSNLARARFEDSVVSSVGTLLKSGEDAPEGYKVMTVVRDGRQIRYAVPEVVASWIDDMERKLLNNEWLAKVARGYDRVQNHLKRMMTVVNPMFHARNLASNFVLAAFDDIADPGAFEDGFKALWAARRGAGGVLIDVGGGRKVDARDLVSALEGSVIRGATGIGDQTRVLSQVRKTLPEKNVLRELAREASPQLVGEELGSFIEDASRMGAYLSAVRKGVPHAAAVELVDRALYNYMPQALTPVEREVFKRVVPFYTWLRRNIPRMVETAIRKPGEVKAVKLLRDAVMEATGVTESDMPQWMRDLYYMPAPGVRTKEGDRIYVGPAMLPLQDLGRIAGGPKEVISMVSPLIKTPIEMMANYDFYFERKIEEGGEPVLAPWYIERAVRVGDEAFGGSEAWQAFKRWAHVYDMQDKDGRVRVAMSAKPRKALKDFLPFIERVGKLFAVIDTKGELDRFTYLTGVPLRAINEAEQDEATSRLIEERIDELLDLWEREGLIHRKRKKKRIE